MKQRFEYLDGLRGIAALIVVIHHGLILFTFGLYSGQPPDSRFSWDIWLSGKPFLLFFAGNFSVAIFFVLSGFVLSHVFSRTSAGPISLVVKRYVRLTVPILGASLFAFCIALIALAVPALHRMAAIGPGLTSLSLGSIATGLDFCLREALVHATLTGLEGGTYNGVLWTMQIEFFGSVLLIAIFWLSRKLTRSPSAALNCAAAIAGVLLLLEYQSQLALFMAGVLAYRFGRSVSPSIMKEIAAGCLLIAGLYLGTMPESPLRPELQNVLLRLTGTDLPTMADHTVLLPLLQHLGFHAWVPFPFLPVPLWRGLGAVLVLVAVLMSGLLRRGLSARICLFLGYISFPLYLTHGNVIDLTAKPAFRWMENVGLSPTVALIGAVSGFVCIALCVAMVFAKLIEGRALRWSESIAGRFAHPFARRITIGPEDP